tara:strand:- start:1090 stop:1311 length:222 start_codon:yes stop_codon:yes gene_type:complete
MNNNKKTWVFYGANKNGDRTIHFIKDCLFPRKTKEQARMLKLLDDDVYWTIGYETSSNWNLFNCQNISSIRTL